MPTRLTLDLVTLIGQMQLVIPYLYLTDFDLVNFTKWDKDRSDTYADIFSNDPYDKSYSKSI